MAGFPCAPAPRCVATSNERLDQCLSHLSWIEKPWPLGEILLQLKRHRRAQRTDKFPPVHHRKPRLGQFGEARVPFDELTQMRDALLDGREYPLELLGTISKSRVRGHNNHRVATKELAHASSCVWYHVLD